VLPHDVVIAMPRLWRCGPRRYTTFVNTFGEWVTRDGLPAFAYRAEVQRGHDPASTAGPSHQLLVGNRCIQICATADGTTGLWDERYGGRWLTLGDPSGTGTSTITEANGQRWGSARDAWPAGAPPVRTFGPTWFEVACERAGLALERMTLCPEGESPWVVPGGSSRPGGMPMQLNEARTRSELIDQQHSTHPLGSMIIALLPHTFIRFDSIRTGETLLHASRLEGGCSRLWGRLPGLLLPPARR